MNKLIPANVHPVDRAIRIILGIVVLALVFTGPHTPWGWLGVIPLFTGLAGTCPLYTVLRISTNRHTSSHTSGLRSSTMLKVLLMLALGATIAASAAETPSPAYPSWTGSQYAFPQHFQLMMVHFDQAAVTMAKTALERGSREEVKQLARAIIDDRDRDIERLSTQYQHRYGSSPPPWPGVQAARGPMPGGMMGGMMYGQGPTGQPESGPRGPGGYGPGSMMGHGDAYQMMMGWSDSYTGGDLDRAFVQAIMRQDAMQITMATVGLEASDPETREVARSVIRSRAAQLEQIAKSYEAWFGKAR